MNRLFFLASRVLQIALTFATLKIGTILLPPGEMAVVFIITSVINLVSSFVINPVGMFINRRMHSWSDAGTVSKYYRAFYVFLGFVGVLTFFLAKIGFQNYSGFGGKPITLVALLIGLGIVAMSANSTALPGLNMLGQSRQFLLFSLGTAISSLAAALFLTTVFSRAAEYWFLGLLAGQSIFAIIGAIQFPAIDKSKYCAKINKSNLQKAAAYAWPISISVGLAWIQTQSYRVLGAPFIGLHEIGLVAAGIGVSVAVVSSVESILSSYLLPAFYKKIQQTSELEHRNAWITYAGLVIPVYILTGIYLISLAPELVRLLMGPGYEGASKYIYLGVLAEIGRATAYAVGMILHAKYKTRQLILPAIIAASISVGIVLGLIHRLGGMAIGMALATSAAVNLAITYLLARKAVSVSLSFRQLAKVFISCCVLYFYVSLLRKFMSAQSLSFTLLMTLSGGLLYLGLIYMLLNKQFRESRE